MIKMQANPGQFYVFETWALAEAAQEIIHQAYVAAGFEDVNAATGERVEPQITTRWADPIQRATDGKWVVPVADVEVQVAATVETLDAGWSPESEEQSYVTLEDKP